MHLLCWLRRTAFVAVCFCVGPAHADCLSDCLGSGCSGVNYDVGIYCKMQSNDCQRRCRESGSRGSGSSIRWGAIAYSDKNRSYGTSHDYATLAQARRFALAECRANDCEVEAWFYNSCGAVAAGDNEVSFGAQGRTRAGAQRAALAGCTRRGGRNCELVVSQCSPE